MNEVPLVYPFHVAPLRQAYDAFAPAIDAETMHLHHDAHHRAYVDRLNEALRDQPRLHGKTIEAILRDLDALPAPLRAVVRDFGGGHANHQFFWKILGRGEGVAPTGDLARAIDTAFGSFGDFRDTFKAAALAHFGSGWTFLVIGSPGGALEIVTLPNQDSVLPIGKLGILCCDLWEHAYYLTHRNRRSNWIDAYFDVVAWDVASLRYDTFRRGGRQA